MNQLAPIVTNHGTALVVASGPRASYRFLEFFTANISNHHTRRAHENAVEDFMRFAGIDGRRNSAR